MKSKSSILKGESPYDMIRKLKNDAYCVSAHNLSKNFSLNDSGLVL